MLSKELLYTVWLMVNYSKQGKMTRQQDDNGSGRKTRTYEAAQLMQSLKTGVKEYNGLSTI